MRRRRALLAMGLSCLINVGLMTLATAEDRPSPEATKQARDKFAKLLLPGGPPKKAGKPGSKARGVVVNAFGSTKVHIH